jgi:hypothetical protein
VFQCTDYLTYLRSWALLEKLPIVQPLKKFPIFYETWRFIIMIITRAHHWSLSWVRWIHSKSSHPISLRPTLILSYHDRLYLPSGLFPSAFPTQILNTFMSAPCFYTHWPHHPPWLYHSNYIWQRVQIMKLLVMQFSPATYYFIPLG